MTAELVAKETFVTEVDGKEVLVHAGDVVPAKSALAKDHKELFEATREARSPRRHKVASSRK